MFIFTQRNSLTLIMSTNITEVLKFIIINLSGSSAGDLGEVTPCNASPNLSSLMNIRMVKSDVLENWTSYIQANMIETPANTLQFFHQFQKLVTVSIVVNCIFQHFF